MNKIYTSPYAEIKSFITEDVIASSGVNNKESLVAIAMKTYSNSDANVSWNSKITN